MVKLLARSIIIISLFIVNKAQSQSTIKDTIGFKKDFEALLKKYGMKSNEYLIKVTSNDQNGGQTALIINNNYYGDTIDPEKNFIFSVMYISGEKKLVVSPKSGNWLSPIVLSNSNIDNICPRSGMYTSYENISFRFNKKDYILRGQSVQIPCTKYSPLRIYLNENSRDEIIVFGDGLDNQKMYLYYDGKVIWIPPQE